MKRFIASSLLASLFCITFAGCDQKSTVTDETKIKTPGGTTTIKTEKEVTKSGDHKTDAPATNP